MIPRADRRTKRLYTMRESAEYMAISYWTVREMVAAGKLPAVRLPGGGQLLRIDVADLDQLIEQSKGEPAP